MKSRVFTTLTCALLLLTACSKTPTKETDSTATPQNQVQNEQVAPLGEAEKPAEKVLTFETYQPTQVVAPLTQTTFTDKDNTILSYIPSSAQIALATTRQISPLEAQKKVTYLQNLSQKMKLKRLGIDAPDFNTNNEETAKAFLDSWGISSETSDAIMFADDDAMVSIYQIVDAEKAKKQFTQQMEIMKAMLPMLGFEWDGKTTSQKDVTIYQFKAIDNALAKMQKTQDQTPKKDITLWTKFDQDKVFLVISAQPKLKVDRYFKPSKKPLSVQKFGTFTENTFIVGYLNNHKFPNIYDVMTRPFGNDLMRMLKLPTAQDCGEDFLRLAKIVPETVFNFRIDDASLYFHTQLKFANSELSKAFQQVKTEIPNLLGPNDEAYVKLQLNAAQLYAILGDAAKDITQNPLKCPRLKDLNAYAGIFPDLFSSTQSQNLLNAFHGGTFVLKDSSIKEDNVHFAYAASVTIDNAEVNIPTLFKLLEISPSEQPTLPTFKKGEIQTLTLPSLPMGINLSEAKVLTTDTSVYMSSADFDIHQVSDKQSVTSPCIAEIFITDESYQAFHASQNLQLKKYREERVETNKKINEDLIKAGHAPMPDPIYSDFDTPSESSLGFTSFLTQIGVIDSGLDLSIQFKF